MDKQQYPMLARVLADMQDYDGATVVTVEQALAHMRQADVQAVELALATLAHTDGWQAVADVYNGGAAAPSLLVEDTLQALLDSTFAD